MEVREPSAKYLARAEFKQTEIGEIPSDWDVVCLSGITETKRPISYGIVQTGPSIVGGVRCLRVLDIDNGCIDTSNLITTSREISDAYRRTLLQSGDLVMPLRGKVGDVALVGDELAGSNITRGLALIAVVPSVFAAYCKHAIAFGPSRARLFQAMNGSALQEISIAQLRAFAIPLPKNHSEQQAIATALSDADALIESLEQLLTKKRQIKQGAMQELLTAKRRLPGFEGVWAKRSLGDLLSIRHGKGQKEVEVADGPYPILATGGQIGTANRFLYDKPSVLIGRKGTINQPQFMDTPFWTVDTLFYSEVNAPNSAKFLFYRFGLIDWMQYNEASGVPSLNARTIEAVEILCPDPDEQTAIAAVLTDMDADITAIEAKLTKARAIKQGMMQELLTGRIRLVSGLASGGA